MEAIAHLQFGDNYTGMYDKQYLVVKCCNHFNRAFNAHNVASEPKCESIVVTIVAPGKNDLELQDWFLSGTSRTGRIAFDLIDNQMAKFSRSIVFDDAQCFKLSESYDIDNSSLRLLTVSFVPRKCEIERCIFKLS